MRKLFAVSFQALMIYVIPGILIFASIQWVLPRVQGTSTSVPDGMSIVVTSESHQQSTGDQQEDAIQQFAFVLTTDNNSEIYLMDSDGNNLHNLTNNPARDHGFTWSPDGQQIVFMSNRDHADELNYDIYILSINSALQGAEPTRLTEGPDLDGSPAWSPNGKFIAFYTSPDNDNWELYLLNLDSNTLTRLPGEPIPLEPPAWSPDSRQIAFVSKDEREVCFVDVAESLNTVASGLSCLTDNTIWHGFPVWSPDGRRVAFTISSRGEKGSDESWIYIMNVVDKSLTKLTESVTDANSPTWSPDSQQIAFMADPVQFSDNHDYEIHIANSDGSNLRRLTSTEFQDFYPVWSPNGRYIIFTSWLMSADGLSSKPEIFIISSDGSGLRHLTKDLGQGYYFDPTWRPYFTSVPDIMLTLAATATLAETPTESYTSTATETPSETSTETPTPADSETATATETLTDPPTPTITPAASSPLTPTPTASSLFPTETETPEPTLESVVIETPTATLPSGN